MATKATVLVACFLAVLGLSAAQVWQTKATGKNQLPTPVNTTTTALIYVKIENDTISGAFQVNNAQQMTMAHLHAGSNTTVSGPVVLWIWPLDTAPKYAPSSQPITGYVTIPFNVSTSALITNATNSNITSLETFISALNASDVYFNVHTKAYPAGVVRGQLA